MREAEEWTDDDGAWNVLLSGLVARLVVGELLLLELGVLVPAPAELKAVRRRRSEEERPMLVKRILMDWIEDWRMGSGGWIRLISRRVVGTLPKRQLQSGPGRRLEKKCRLGVERLNLATRFCISQRVTEEGWEEERG